MGALIDSLRNSETSSSLVPLLIVASILGATFLTAFVLSLVKVWQTVRQSRERLAKENASGGPPAEKAGGPALVARILHDVIHPETKLEKPSELQKQVDFLKGEAFTAKDLHAKAIGRIAELEGTIKNNESRHQENTKLLEIETQRRLRVEATAQVLEAQIKDIIREVEKIYSQTSNTADGLNLNERIAEILKEAGNGKKLQERLDAQDAEIKQLKTVLTAAKQQLIELTKPK